MGQKRYSDIVLDKVHIVHWFRDQGRGKVFWSSPKNDDKKRQCCWLGGWPIATSTLQIAASQGANIYVIGKPAPTHSVPQSVHVSNLLLRCKIFAPRKQTGLYLILVCNQGFIHCSNWLTQSQYIFHKTINNSIKKTLLYIYTIHITYVW